MSTTIWIDRDNAEWKELRTGLLQFNEGTPMPRDYVEQEWGPLHAAEPAALPEDPAPILSKSQRKAVRQAVKELYDGAYATSQPRSRGSKP